MTAKVLKSVGSLYTVCNDNNEIVTCKLKGKLRLKDFDSTNPIAVGDNIEYEWDEVAGHGLITDVLPRHNYIVRKSVNLSKQKQILASNIDLAFLIVTPLYPRTSTGFIDRFIATAEAYHITPVLVFNKADLFEGDGELLMEEYFKIYKPLDYKCIIASAINGKGIEEIKTLMHNKTSLFAGHSGVGKTTLINAIQPALNLRTGKISDQHAKGKHTTTFAEMFLLDFGAYIIDTPGIRDLGTVDFVPQEISHYFVEMRERIHDCKFNNCLHENENNCAIKQAVADGEIHPSRYYNYLSMLHNEDNYK